ncbi:hypothetical protein ACJX0J_010983 [Zea mays]
MTAIGRGVLHEAILPVGIENFLDIIQTDHIILGIFISNIFLGAREGLAAHGEWCQDTLLIHNKRLEDFFFLSDKHFMKHSSHGFRIHSNDTTVTMLRSTSRDIFMTSTYYIWIFLFPIYL